MEGFIFECPECGHHITEQDFKNKEQILSKLKTIFDQHKDSYIKILKKELTSDFEKSFNEKLEKQLALKENEFNKLKQEELDKLKDVINKQILQLNKNESELTRLLSEKETEISKIKQKEIDALKEAIINLNITVEKNKIESEKLLAEKENQFNISKQIEIKQLNDLINKQNIEISNNKANLESIIAQKENEIYQEKQKEIDALRESIAKLNNVIESNKLELNKVIAEKENEFNKAKQLELDKLNELINKQNIEISNNKANLENLLSEKEKQLLVKNEQVIVEYEDKIKTYLNQIKDLEVANATNKVIQNKTKGENFEHDVYGELLKVFEDDRVTKITSQDKKADYLQEVFLDTKVIGKIVYEVKNAEWSNAWEKKLIEDMAKQGSKYGIIVATSFNKKYPGIPFKKSDINQNIYLCDADSFIFIGQIIRSIIKIENKFENQRSITNYDEKIKEYNQWKEVQLPKLLKIFEDSFERIKENESSIIKRVDDIRIAREKMQNNALHNIREYIDNLIF
ncbi:hypothetical protein SCORR_v1c06930 [Spiroplasma corruscae]|uniref:DUF2130 domain-containing protein n=1 Tax=Spiroplasma corruscae TaxID=216934 RepID=A0A222EPJ0_9MOLU|nr:DUF2130 domain-containing protein [Spiroplasma corruscae]ASP28465.1 hypothetical protein SCORR_v1c06930 [Spiroplasma corruscae]